MDTDNSIIEGISHITEEVIETALNVNQLSHTRKQITYESIMLLNELLGMNNRIDKNIGIIYKNLHEFILGMSDNIKGFRQNGDHFNNIILNINDIKNRFHETSKVIMELIDIVEEIKIYTDEIYILATNAAIESSKYHSISPVFEILSDRLNTLSIFINENLEHIIEIVEPISNGIDNLIQINTLVLNDIQKGHQSFTNFSKQLEDQEHVINELIMKAYMSGSKIDDQKKMLEDINGKIIQMDKDALQAINGSSNVMNIGKGIKDSINFLIDGIGNGRRKDEFLNKINFIEEQSSTIWHTAQNVNEKSRSQLEFSYSSLEFCDSIIQESKEMEKTITIFNKESIESNELTTGVTSVLGDMSAQLKEIEKRITDSNKTLNRFTGDFHKINNIVDILQKILKMMKIIGIYSRIESARNPQEFKGFITISDSIQQLQNNIKQTLPRIQENINKTKQTIDMVDNYFKNITFVFYKIRESSTFIIKNLEEISTISSNDEKISKIILEDSLNLDTLLNDLRSYLVKLTDVVKQPIEGSAANIKRGKDIEEKSIMLKKQLESDNSHVDL